MTVKEKRMIETKFCCICDKEILEGQDIIEVSLGYENGEEQFTEVHAVCQAQGEIEPY